LFIIRCPSGPVRCFPLITYLSDPFPTSLLTAAHLSSLTNPRRLHVRVFPYHTVRSCVPADGVTACVQRPEPRVIANVWVRVAPADSGRQSNVRGATPRAATNRLKKKKRKAPSRCRCPVSRRTLPVLRPRLRKAALPDLQLYVGRSQGWWRVRAARAKPSSLSLGRGCEIGGPCEDPRAPRPSVRRDQHTSSAVDDLSPRCPSLGRLAISDRSPVTLFSVLFSSSCPSNSSPPTSVIVLPSSSRSLLTSFVADLEVGAHEGQRIHREQEARA